MFYTNTMMLHSEIDYEDFSQILSSCFPDEVIDEQVFLNNISRDQFLFVSKNSLLLGYLLFDLKTQPARLIQLCIKEGHRRLGLGTFLINQLKVQLKKYHIPDIVLNVDFTNTKAINFYTEHGFTKEYTNTQFTYHQNYLEGVMVSDLIIRELTQVDEIKNEMTFGENMARYIVGSSNNLVYVIENDHEELIGHFLYNPAEIKVTHFVFDNPERINELVTQFIGLIPLYANLLIESFDPEIDHYLEKFPGMVTEYKLQIMKFSI